MKLETLKNALSKSWSKETSYCPKAWSKENPAAGQCCVTSLIVHNYFGGKLIIGTVGKASHWWNQLPSGEEVDLTIEQFNDTNIVKTKVNCYADSKHLKRIKTVEKRYKKLYLRVQDQLLKIDA